MKGIIFFLKISLVGLLFTISIPTFAYDFEVNGLYYNILSNNQVEVTFKKKNDKGYLGNLLIPEKVKYEGQEYVVTSIGDWAFWYCDGITGSLNLPNTITTIGVSAFQECKNLTGELKIPNSVKTIGTSAFAGCIGFTGSLIIPSSVTVIGDCAFGNCTSLTGTLNIPSSVVTLREAAFIGCSGFSGLNLPNSLTEIADWTFNGCSGLTGTLTIPNSVKTIGSHAFWGCEGLTGSLIIPNSVTDIGEYAFSMCKGFSGELVIPSSVKSIGIEAFWNCNGFIGTLTIPNSVSSIGGWAFERCKGFSGSLIIPNSVTVIENGVFSGCSGLTSITIPNTVTRIDNYAFQNCQNVTYVKSYIAPPITIGNDAFNKISSTARIEVPRGTKSQYQAISGWSKHFAEIVEFDDSPITYTLSITASGNGSVSYEGTTIRGKTTSFTVDEGTSAKISFSTDDGYRIKSVKVNNSTVSVSNNQYTITNIKANTTVSVEFEAIPVTTYALSITASGNGSASYDGTTIRGKTSSFTVNEGKSANIKFTPDDGYQIKEVRVNGSVVSISNWQYTISSMNRNTTVEVEFVEILSQFESGNINYRVVSNAEKTVRVAAGSYGQVLDVPATVSYQNADWTVTGITNGALAENTNLAAIIWHPETAFTEEVSNPNLLLYVNKAQYAPSNIRNVVADGSASSITLTDADNGNNFYCPQEFTAQKIVYSHSYGMTTGIGEAKGWETMALPFDVQKITHSEKGEVVPFATWKSGDTKKPFWLMELSNNGFVEADGIKANTPYIISMPNHKDYLTDYILSGKVTFSAENVTVKKSDDIEVAHYGNKAFWPNFTEKGAGDGLYALNVNNELESNNSGMTEGSRFILNIRAIHPFEAYMTSSAATRSIGIFEDMTTSIPDMRISELQQKGDKTIFDLQGRKVAEPRNGQMKKGVYIKNGKKYIVR